MSGTHKLSAQDIARFSIGDDRAIATQTVQTSHRLDIVDAWGGIKPGHQVLEIGCGQGDMTAVLATLVGDTGKVIAIDPADAANYGSPFTLKQAQDHLLASRIGHRIKFVESDTINFIRKTEEKFDAVVLAQCLWYFYSPTIVEETLRAIKTYLKGTPKLLLAEYALETRMVEAMPHIHAVLAQGALEVCKPTSTSNVRTVLSPAAIKDLAAKSEWSMLQDKIITPDRSYQDARWEIHHVASHAFLEEIHRVVKDERQKAFIIALKDSVLRHAKVVGREECRSMDVWAAVFE